LNIGVLVSGGGTNLPALLDAADRGELGPARIVVVGANVPGCGGLLRAQQAGVPTFAVDHKAFAGREPFERVLVDELRARDVQAVVLAGFMRLLTPTFLDAFPQRVINIHPALLPSFPGIRSQQQAFERGVKIAGCTVHFADGGTDSGPIIAQAAVPVLEGDDAEALRLRILAEEHHLLPAAVRALAEGRLTIEGHRVRIAGATAVTARDRLGTL
jgi:phosphoribosylglycinamide formyltransferase-1